MADYQGVMIVAETQDGALAGVSKELLGVGRRLANALGEGLSAALVGSSLGSLPQELIAYGAEKVYVVDDPRLAEYQSDAYVAALEKICHQASPQILLLGHTISLGRDAAPRLAFRLGTAMASDCVAVEIHAETKKMHALRAVYGGNAQAEVAIETLPQVATIRPKSQPEAERDDARSGEVVAMELGEVDARDRFIERVKVEAEGVRLEDAPVVVSGGRGMGSTEPFAGVLKELADMLGGAVACTKAVVDAEWQPFSRQVGLTGKIVSPDIYIAVALSGAAQHMQGCSGAKTIVAINRDRNADIFRYARYGVVANWEEVLPAFIRRVKELLAG